ncbi:LCP family protein [Tsukamurella soli]|uniref:Cell envelope-related function transcriptional attenuator common domain-containing protein n=1 Tax=Tsukamurella soli TaxID=644556 RepID=A0ABP8KAD6_9ACTN
MPDSPSSGPGGSPGDRRSPGDRASRGARPTPPRRFGGDGADRPASGDGAARPGDGAPRPRTTGSTGAPGHRARSAPHRVTVDPGAGQGLAWEKSPLAEAADGAETPRHGRYRRSRPQRDRSSRSAGAAHSIAPTREGVAILGMACVAFLAVIVLLVTGYAWARVDSLESAVKRVSIPRGSAPDGATDILLVGTDSRVDAQGNPMSEAELAKLHAGVDDGSINTDTIILIRIPNDGRSATAMSIPRDSWVDIPGIGYAKINSAFGSTYAAKKQQLMDQGESDAQATDDATQAGRDVLIETVANLTGVTVDHYAEIGLVGFSLLTNAVGGVQVCLKHPVNDVYSGAHFRSGLQTLDGPQALSFVRQRHGLPRGDFDRIVRQQEFMASLAHKVLSAGTLSNPNKLDQLEAAVHRSVTIDDQWNTIDFARQLADLSAGSIKFATIPVVRDDGVSPDGQSIVVVDPNQVHAYTRALLGPGAVVGGDSGDPATSTSAPKPAVERGDISVDVVNGSQTAGLASSVSEYLAAKGYARGTVGDADTRDTDIAAGSVVAARSASDAGAKAVAAELGGLPVKADRSVAAGHVRVILEDGYTGPGKAGSDSSGSDESSSTDPNSLDPTEAAIYSSILNRPAFSADQDGGIPCVD